MERERRASDRAAYGRWVEIHAEGRRWLGQGQTLSTGGMAIRFDASALEPFPDDLPTRVSSEFALPGIALPLVVESEVCWSDAEAGCLGLRFQGLDEGLRELIAHFVGGAV